MTSWFASLCRRACPHGETGFGHMGFVLAVWGNCWNVFIDLMGNFDSLVWVFVLRLWDYGHGQIRLWMLGLSIARYWVSYVQVQVSAARTILCFRTKIDSELFA